MVHVKAVVAYDGTGYGGFQRQKNAPSIQEELEQTLERLTGVPTRVLAAGRTDAGVHAEGQVIAFDTNWSHPLVNLHRGMNALLSSQVAILSLEMAGPAFHPRYDAVRRCYRYTIYRGAVRDPLVARFSIHIARPLDVEAMQAATEMLLGRQDFAAFGSPPAGVSTIREVYSSGWIQQDSWLYFDIEANAFLYRMVRMLVGTLLRVGYGTLTVEEFSEILKSKVRGKAGPAVSAQGLTLKAVFYAT
jgi:tRNA pseudouridine38-40 synthase